MPVYGKILGNAKTSKKSFAKSDFNTVAFTKTDNFLVSTATDLFLEVANEYVIIDSGTPVVMPSSATIGTDYAIWVHPNGTLEATTNFITAPVTYGRKIGGFHYAPGGNATGANTGGTTIAQINPYSFWDLKFRPVCTDPRGMTLVNNSFWCDIYLTGVDAITNGSSKYNVTIADGSSPPKVPVMFGGTGSSTYGAYTWFEAMELAGAFGKRGLSYYEFEVAAFGTKENQAVGSDQVSTILNAEYTSKWGLIQSTGCMWIWGKDRGGPYAAASWNANTEGRGSEYNAPNASRFGGTWGDGSDSGSRCSGWDAAASASHNYIGSRFACDHLILGA